MEDDGVSNPLALNLDITQQHKFIRFFNELPEKPSSTVRLFNRTDYYTLHGDDATLAATFTSKIINYMGDKHKLSYVCINTQQMEMLLRELLLIRQYRVEVYVNSPGKGNDWQLEYKGSPGNLSQFEQILFEDANIYSSAVIMGIKLCKNYTVAVASVNTTDLKLEVGEFIDNECFTEIEAVIAQVSPKECIIPSGNSPECHRIKSILERNGILVTQVKRSDFNSEEVIQDLNRLLYFSKHQERNSKVFSETDLIEAMGCLQAVFKYLNLTSTDDNYNQFKIGKLDAQRYVRLDNAALYALNVISKPIVNSEGAPVFGNQQKSHNLLDLFNSCVTSQGRRLLEQWIKEPLKDLNRINERLDIVECFVKNSEIRTLLRKGGLAKMPDLMTLSKKILGKRAKLQDCYKLYQAINDLSYLTNSLQKLNNMCVRATFVNPLSDLIADMDKYQTMIETMLDLDLVDRCEFLIKSTVNSEINELYLSKRKIEEKMQTLLRKAADDLNFEEGKSIKLECNPQHGYFFRVVKRDEQAVRHTKSYKIIDAVAAGVRFTNETLVTLNRDYSEVNEKYEEIQKKIVDEILKVAGSYADTVRSINMIVATLDVLILFANLAVSAKVPYVRPILKLPDEGVLKLQKVRHPCLEQQDHIDFIPNDVNFNRKDKHFYIITGPNMCGKSTYIRSVGICVLMAHIGSFVPCDYAEISLVDAILARVGADDCQQKGLSTFMIEMIESSTIIKTATKNSLVIIDELGRGTSTFDGCGIAWAIAEHLATEVKCFSLFATHFFQITNISDMYPMVGNLHVSAITSDNEITSLYLIKEGECDKSYGIHCAKVVDFPSDVLEKATNNLNKLEHDEGMRHIKNCDVAAKKKIVQGGSQIVKEYLNKLKTNIDCASDADLEELICTMKNELTDTNNLFVKGLIQN